ncbi:hypothetical protein FZW96_13130 [Bacillus sp. BGMRC 2118]|nr:hypothetical protein FZW96_13130 [Bacillus sp. BGMRC 2118]
MKKWFIYLILISSIMITGCTHELTTMTLLDEKIERIDVSISNGTGSVNEETLSTLDDKTSIKQMERIITYAELVEADTPMKNPDYDVVVSYGDDFPKHAIHIWLGEEGEKSTLSYLVEDGGTYYTSVKDTKKLRELILDK